MKSNLYSEFAMYAPDEGGGAGAASAQADTAPVTAPAAPGGAPAAAVSSPATAAPAVAPSGGAPTGQAPVAPAAPSWLDNLKGAGLPVGKDEAETIANWKRIHGEHQGYSQIQHLLPHVQDWMHHAAEYKKWREEQAKAKPAAQASPSDPWWKADWQPPEYNRMWRNQVTRDEKGNLIPAPGAPPEVVSKYRAATEFRDEFAEKFLDNPYEALAPLEKRMEQRAQEIAEKVISERMQQTQARTNAMSFIEQNQHWLYDIDPATKQPKRSQSIDPNTGQWREGEVLSPWGERMSKYAEGIRKAQQERNYFDQAEIQNLAYAQVQRDYSTWLLSQVGSGQMTQQQVADLLSGKPSAPAAPVAPAVHPQDAANQAMLDKINPAGAGGRNGQPPPADAPITEKTLRAELLRAFKKGGITRETLRN